jgi:hypothetical protein
MIGILPSPRVLVLHSFQNGEALLRPVLHRRVYEDPPSCMVIRTLHNPPGISQPNNIYDIDKFGSIMSLAPATARGSRNRQETE